ncbi:phage baseplate protein [Lysinibacillus sp. FSL K6-0075]|uniref:phage baseplate protein n=1 Tax=Lysinibacillus sp. FSL K6-0075 TaxID=2921415 RepID=UPI0031580C16
MPYIKDVLIDVITKVSMPESSTTTDHALEDGEQITDHVKSNPITISLTGVILDETEAKVLKLREYREKGVIIDFDYMTKLNHMVITDFSRDYEARVKDGYAFTMTLKQIKVGKVAKFVSVSIPVKKQTKAVTKKGRQQTKKTPTTTAKTTKEKYTTPPKSSSGGWAGMEGRK